MTEGAGRPIRTSFAFSKTAAHAKQRPRHSKANSWKRRTSPNRKITCSRRRDRRCEFSSPTNNDRSPGARHPQPTGFRFGRGRYGRSVIPLLGEEQSRRCKDRADCVIAMRPDHGQLNARDVGLGSPHGYCYIGRLKGLAELRGVVAGVLPHLNATRWEDA